MKLFRKSRFNFLKRDKIGSYVIYALGEIFLVVIGILIAVYINNKNDERKEVKELNTIFSIIKSDLLNDIEEANTIIALEESKKEFYKGFFNNSLTEKNYQENFLLRKLIFGYLEISFNKRGFN